MNKVNEYGVPLHACNGYRLDEHYWAWLTHLRLTGQTRQGIAEKRPDTWTKTP